MRGCEEKGTKGLGEICLMGKVVVELGGIGGGGGWSKSDKALT